MIVLYLQPNMRRVIYSGDGDGFYSKDSFRAFIESLNAEQVAEKSSVSFDSRSKAELNESHIIWHINDYGVTIEYYIRSNIYRNGRIYNYTARVVFYGTEEKIGELERSILQACQDHSEIEERPSESRTPPKLELVRS